METAADPGEVAGGSRRAAQSRVNSERDGGSEYGMTAAVDGEREEVGGGRGARWLRWGDGGNKT